MSRIVIDENRCKGCGLCTTACPFDLIRIADRFNAKGYRPAEYVGPSDSQHSRSCTGCANCATMCPDVAITVYRTSSKRRSQRENDRTGQHIAVADKQVRTRDSAPAVVQSHADTGRSIQMTRHSESVPASGTQQA
jgi:2-oxoglutarate ferredoxin oxidoreductase subunit delta